MKRSRAMFFNLIIMTLTTLLIRFVGMAFSVYVSRRLGAYGVGLYTLIVSVGAFALTFATSGVNLAATRLTAEAIGRGSDSGIRCAMRKCIAYSLCFGFAATAGLAILAKPVSLHVLKNAECIVPLRIMAISMPCISLSSALYGYFTARRRVIKSAAGQIFEQFVKICATVVLIAILSPRGAGYACIAVVAGGVIAEVSSFVFSYVLYRVDLKRHVGRDGPGDKKALRKLFDIALPIALTTYVRSGLLTVEHLLIPWGLKRSGKSAKKAIASYGVLHGMALPIVLFPQTLMTAFASLLVPEISECMARGEEERIDRIVSRVIQASLCFSCGVAGIMLCYADLLGEAIYANREAGAMIRMLAPLVPVMYLDHVVDGMLKGLGEQLYSMKVNIADAAASVVLVYFLVPVLGVNGYVYVIIVMEIVNASFSLARLLSRARIRITPVKWLIKPLACVAGATAAVSAAVRLMPLPGRVSEAAIAVTLSSAAYYALLRLTGGISSGDVKWLKSSVKR